MRKKISHLTLLIFFCIIGCSEEPVCVDSSHFALLSVVSTSNIDSVQFYLNNQRICNGKADKKWVMCKDAAESLSDILVLKMPYDNCSISNEIPVWTGFVCEIRDSVNIDSSKLSVWIFSNEDTSKINPDFNVFGGLQINAVPERDSLKWFGYRNNPAIPNHEAFETPAVAERLGCFDGLCFSSMQSIVKEHCYDE